MSRFVLLLSIGVLSGLLGCSSSDPEARACTPGQQIACACPGGPSGAQACNAAGSGYGACDCGADANVDATGDGGADASPDDTTSAPSDASDAGDAIDVSDAPAGCAPADVSAYSPPAFKPAARKAGACTSTLIAAFYSVCLSESAPAGECAKQFGSSAATVNKECAACLVTSIEASALGPLIDRMYTLNVNLAGCIELTGGSEGLACAKAIQIAEGCGQVACAASCPVTDAPSLAALASCLKAAATGGCAKYQEPATTCMKAAQAGASAGCFPAGDTFKDMYDAIAPVFCGP